MKKFLFLLVLAFVGTQLIALKSVVAQKKVVTSKTSCCCSVTISGQYTFFVEPSGSSSTGPFTATFSQSGCTFKTTEPTSNGYQIYGTITGNQVNFTYVVDGEEAEGYALQGRGMARKTAAGANIIVAVYQDTNAVVGSWTASKAP